MDQPQAPAKRELLACPQCQHPLPGDARTCPNCGVDLALLALLAERAFLEGVPQSAPLPATPESIVLALASTCWSKACFNQLNLSVPFKSSGS